MASTYPPTNPASISNPAEMLAVTSSLHESSTDSSFFLTVPSLYEISVTALVDECTLHPPLADATVQFVVGYGGDTGEGGGRWGAGGDDDGTNGGGDGGKLRLQTEGSQTQGVSSTHGPCAFSYSNA